MFIWGVYGSIMLEINTNNMEGGGKGSSNYVSNLTINWIIVDEPKGSS